MAASCMQLKTLNPAGHCIVTHTAPQPGAAVPGVGQLCSAHLKSATSLCLVARPLCLSTPDAGRVNLKPRSLLLLPMRPSHIIQAEFPKGPLHIGSGLPASQGPLKLDLVGVHAGNFEGIRAADSSIHLTMTLISQVLLTLHSAGFCA